MWTNNTTNLGSVETLLRLKCIDQYISALFCGERPAPQPPLWHLRVLQDEHRHAGRKDMANMCRELERLLIALDQDRPKTQDADIVPASRIKHLVEIVNQIKANATDTKSGEQYQPPKAAPGIAEQNSTNSSDTSSDSHSYSPVKYAFNHQSSFLRENKHEYSKHAVF